MKERNRSKRKAESKKGEAGKRNPRGEEGSAAAEPITVPIVLTTAARRASMAAADKLASGRSRDDARKKKGVITLYRRKPRRTLRRRGFRPCQSRRPHCVLTDLPLLEAQTEQGRAREEDAAKSAAPLPLSVPSSLSPVPLPPPSSTSPAAAITSLFLLMVASRRVAQRRRGRTVPNHRRFCRQETPMCLWLPGDGVVAAGGSRRSRCSILPFLFITSRCQADIELWLPHFVISELESGLLVPFGAVSAFERASIAEILIASDFGSR
ncbi:uncharacterized protein DS421_2g50460 [Arachis hypogaea]|nr:uncharacterized protein DS421_2g50460 [Arachis hypogaea]